MWFGNAGAHVLEGFVSACGKCWIFCTWQRLKSLQNAAEECL